jgi:hypothetical protein
MPAPLAFLVVAFCGGKYLEFADDRPLFFQNALTAADAATFYCTSRSRIVCENERLVWIHKMPGSRFGRIVTRSSDEPTRNSAK